MGAKTAALAIVTPVYNDWQSFAVALKEISNVASDISQPVIIIAVNDGSHTVTLPATNSLSPFVRRVEVIHLSRNLAHQRAIASGLAALCESNEDMSAIVVMDADGEDCPQNIASLLEAYQQFPTSIIVAQRRQRTEARMFQLFYQIYKLLFVLATGEIIDFGNFCLIPIDQLDNLTHDPNLWNHLGATINRGKTPIKKVQIDRCKRYFGESHMNFQNLVLHGLSAISVYLDIVATRALIVSSFIAVVTFAGILIVLYVLVFTNLAIPGWATSAIGILTILIFQSLFFSAGTVLVILNRRSNVFVTPALDTLKIIKQREVIHPQ